MLKTILKTSALSLLAVAIAGVPAPSLAQVTNNAPVEKKAGIEKKTTTKKKEASKSGKKQSAHRFHGKLVAVDNVAKTIKVGESSYQISSQTIILKEGKPAILEDGLVGEEVGGYAKPGEGGKMVATTVNFGPKVEEKSAEKPKESAPKPAEKAKQ